MRMINTNQLKILVFSTICFSFFSFYGQHSATYTGAQQDGVFSDKVGPSFQSPTAAAFNNYVAHPTVSNDGKIDITVPIYTIEDRDINLPIQLSYNSGGVKVNSKSTWVGTGWKLMAGGLITRTVKDVPDDALFFQTAVNDARDPHLAPVVQGWLHSEFIPEEKISNFPNTNLAQSHIDYRVEVGRHLTKLRGEGERVKDMEPDLYHFYANGQSFDFVFNEQGIPKILGLADYKIEYEMTDYSDVTYNPQKDPNFHIHDHYFGKDYRHYLTQFIVTDPRGFKYFFEYKDTEKTKVTHKKHYLELSSDRPVRFYNFDEEQPEHISAWYLSKIESPTKAELLFSYQDELIIDMPRIPVYRGFCETGANCTTDEDRNKYQMLDDDPSIERRSKYEVKSKFLSRISSNNIVVDFISGANREDSNGGKVLSSITIKDAIPNSPIQQFDLDYFYQTAADCPNNLENSNWCKRLYLNKIDEVQGINKITRFKFEYETTKLPHRFSYEQDAWGYYNDNNAQSLIPQMHVYPSFDGMDRYRIYPATASGWILNGSNRQPNPVKNKAGMLSKIIFPTGGSRTYVFESNTYYDQKADKNYLGGGLRIKQIIHDDEEGTTITKNYSYDKTIAGEELSSGVLFANPIFGTEINFFRKPGSNVYQDRAFRVFRWGIHDEDDPYVQTEFDEWNVYTKRSSHPFNQIENGQGNSVLYTKVTESITGNGKTVHLFNAPETYDTHPTVVKEGFYRISTYSNVATNLPPNPDVCYFINDPDYPNQPGGGNMYVGKLARTGTMVQPYPPMSRTEANLEYQRGRKSSTVHYSESGKKVSETKYTYTIYRDNDELIYGLVYKDFEAVCRNWSPSLNLFGWAKYHYITNAGAQLTETTTKTFDTNDQNSYAETTERFYYEAHPQNSLLTKKEFIDSKGDSYITNTFYPFHSEVSGLAYMTDLVNQHRIAEPIKQIVKENNEVVSTHQNHYDNFNGLILQKNISRSKGDFELQEISTIDRRDAKGNIQQYHRNDGVPITIVWGYNDQYPIAKIENIAYNDLINDLVNLRLAAKSNDDNDRTLYYQGKEGALREALDQLRDQLGDTAMVSTYTYDPLVGVTSMTDPRGYTVYYEYDEFNRLEYVRDADGNLISENKYNYKN